MDVYQWLDIQDEVYLLRVKILWLVSCRGHMIDRFHDYNIIIAFLFGHKLHWVCSCLSKISWMGIW